jgi:TM2 domain-containing membrane protein YozV
MCPSCGAPQHTGPVKNQTVAWLWCLFLGGFGAHRFYLGKILTAILYLVLCWTGIPTILAMIELCIIAFTSPQNWAQKYNGGKILPPVNGFIKAVSLIMPIIIIVGIISAIAIPSYQQYMEKQRNLNHQSVHS